MHKTGNRAIGAVEDLVYENERRRDVIEACALALRQAERVFEDLPSDVYSDVCAKVGISLADETFVPYSNVREALRRVNELAAHDAERD